MGFEVKLKFATRVIVLSAIAIVLLGNRNGVLADCTNCGDADGNGMYTVADIAYITAFLYAGGPAPAECADIDGYDLITIRDVVAGGMLIPPTCVTQPKLVAQPTSIYWIRYFNSYVPANVSTYDVAVLFRNNSLAATARIKGFDLPLSVKVDGQAPLSLSASAVGSTWPGGVFIITDSASGTILVSALNGSVGAGYYNLFTFTISVEPSPNGHPITLEYAEMAPTMTGVFAPPNSACHYVMVLDSNLNAWEPYFDPQCKCGDADNSGFWSISDVVFIINHIFAGGPAAVLVCLEDADGNGMMTISDAVYLIGYIFVGGPAPGGC